MRESEREREKPHSNKLYLNLFYFKITHIENEKCFKYFGSGFENHIKWAIPGLFFVWFNYIQVICIQLNLKASAGFKLGFLE